MSPVVAKLVAAAAKLGPDDMSDLRREVDSLEMDAQAIKFNCAGTSYRLVRMGDGDFMAALQSSLAIKDDNYFLWRYVLQDEPDEELTFGEVYAALKARTGESGRWLDDWKSSFSFPFALDVAKGNRVFPYLLEVRNVRSSLEFPLRRRVPPDDPRLAEHLIHEPLADEFSRAQINYFLSYFFGYLQGYWKAVRDSYKEPFVQQVTSNLIVFGCCNGEFFDEQYDSEKAFRSAVRRYEKKVSAERATLASRRA